MREIAGCRMSSRAAAFPTASRSLARTAVHAGRPGFYRAHAVFLSCHGRCRGPAGLLLQGRHAGIRAALPGPPSSRSPTMTATACSRVSAISWSMSTSACCSSPCTAGRSGCASTARQRSTAKIRCWARPSARRLIVRVAARVIFPNCPRYIPDMQLVDPSVYAPRPGVEPPEPAWKDFDRFQGLHPSAPADLQGLTRLPDGQITILIFGNRVKRKICVIENNSVYPEPKSALHLSPIPSRPEGRIMIATIVGRVAVDAGSADSERAESVRQRRVVLTPQASVMFVETSFSRRP